MTTQLRVQPINANSDYLPNIQAANVAAAPQNPEQISIIGSNSAPPTGATPPACGGSLNFMA